MDQIKQTRQQSSAPKNNKIDGSRRSKLSDAKRALLEKRLRGSGQKPLPQVHKRPDGAPLLATFAQERLWFLHQLNPTSAAYNMYAYVRIQGPLNAAWLHQSINRVVQRHEILRTTFIASDSVDNQPLLQQIAPALDIPLSIDDLRSFAPAAGQAEQERLIHLEARAPFDLTIGPLLRTRLLRLDDQEWLFLLTLHHAIIDEWSVGLFWQEVSTAYTRLAAGDRLEVVSLTEPDAIQDKLTFQYADFAYWQRQRFQSGALDREKAYWQKQLQGDLPQLQLPLDRARPAVQSFDGGLESIDLPETMASALRLLSQERGVTLFPTLLAAFNLLLHRYSGQSDILVGTPIANRSAKEYDELIGFFLNTLVLRTDLSGDPTFLELLDRTKEGVLGAFSHQELPFEKLVESLNVTRDPSLNPLFQVMFVLQLDQTKTVELPGLALSPYRFDAGVSKFDLTLFLNASGDQLSAAIEYNSALFEAETIRRMLRHLRTLLAAIVDDPTTHISDLPLLDPRDEAQIVIDLNRTAVADAEEASTDLCIHQLIEKVAFDAPLSDAIIYEGETLSYAQLDQRANQLAHHLQALGVEPEICVGICMERSVEMFVAMLGVLKAGGAYVPIDPAYPPERVAFMLEDCAAPVLLTTAQVAKSVDASSLQTSPVQSICLDQAWPQISQESVELPDSPVAPENLAYMIYTSGSTGTPKGVMITHRNLVHSTNARFRYYPEKVQRFLLLSSFSFDSSVVGIYWTLCSGGTLILPRTNDEKDLLRLADLIEQQRVSHLLALPSLYELLLTYAQPQKLRSLRTAIVAGESCPPRLPALHFGTVPQSRLYNEYGPTEGTVWSTVSELIQSDRENRTLISIGRPIPNMQAYILDEKQRLLPIGVVGELYIGGVGVARGYHNRPELTDERFIATDCFAFRPKDQLEGSTQAKLYRTGDLARWLADGNIEFLGRVDQQVKIRGHRIELSEIEQILSRCESVREVIVTVYEQPEGTQGAIPPDPSLDALLTELTHLDPSDAAQLLDEVEMEMA